MTRHEPNIQSNDDQEQDKPAITGESFSWPDTLIIIMASWSAALACIGLSSPLLAVLLEPVDRPALAPILMRAILAALAGAIILRTLRRETEASRHRALLMTTISVALLGWISVNVYQWQTTDLLASMIETARIVGAWLLLVSISWCYAGLPRAVAWFGRALLVLALPTLAFLTTVDDPQKVVSPLREWFFPSTPGGDTLVHVIISAGLTAAAVLAGPTKRGRGFWCFIVVVSMYALAPAIELIQVRFGRGNEVSDAIGHALGTTLGLMLVLAIWQIAASIATNKYPAGGIHAP